VCKRQPLTLAARDMVPNKNLRNELYEQLFFRLKWCKTIHPSSEDCVGVWAQLKAICRARIVLNEKVERAPMKYSGFCQKKCSYYDDVFIK